jgi:hypothetical protein
MTIKFPDCQQCRNTGRYLIATPTPAPWLNNAIASNGSFTTEEVFCSCYYGEQLQIIENRMRHPEYENPFESMTDEEILERLTNASKDLDAIASEFDVPPQ